MKPTSSNDGLLSIWMDLTAEPVWKYEELPPFVLPELMQLDLSEVNDSELSRAIWFWFRRPKPSLHDSAMLMVAALAVLVSLIIALVNWRLASAPKRAAEVIILLLQVAVGIWVIVNRRGFLRWRREYELSVDRVIRTICQGW
jgi:hypothetical protein